MIVGFRAWGLRRRPTGRILRRAVPRWTLPIRDLSWSADGVPCLDCETEIISEPETEEVLVGQGGAPAERAWEPDWTLAACLAGHIPPTDHAPWPTGDPGCGFYVMQEGIGSAVPTAGTLGPAPGSGLGCGCLIAGLGGLAGDVVEAERGYRGAEGKVLALLAPVALSPSPTRMTAAYPYDNVVWEPVVSHNAAEHLEGLVARYQVPVFTNPAELIAYARRYTRRPIQAEWVTDLSPPPPWAEFSFLSLAGVGSPAARARQLFDVLGFPPTPSPPTAWTPAVPTRRPPARRPPWWGAGQPQPGWVQAARGRPFRWGGMVS